MAKDREEAGMEEELAGVIIRVEPGTAEENLFRQFAEQLPPGIREERFKELEEVSREISMIIHNVMKSYLAGMLVHIVPPQSALLVALDRAGQFIEIMMLSIREKVTELVKKVEAGIPPEDFEKEIRELARAAMVSLTASREILNRIVTLVAINLPPGVRPPLVSTKLGHEILAPAPPVTE